MAELTAQTLSRARRADERAHLINELQRHLLPPIEPLEGLAIAVRYQPAGQNLGIGGDWYDVIPLDEDRTALVVGDISGHGINAAAQMAVLRTSLSASIRLGTSIDAVFDTVEGLVAHLNEPFLGSAAVAVLDRRLGQVVYSSAGHPPMVLKRPGEKSVVLEGATRPVLGVGSSVSCSATASVPPGSVLLAYTDGLVEGRREHFDLALERVTTEMDSLHDPLPDVEEIADTLLATAGDPLGLRDDVALIVAHVPRGARRRER